MADSKTEKLIDLYGNDIYSFCRKLTFSEFDAEELYQDTFLKAVDISDKIDLDNNPKSFLISIAVSLWKGKKRKYARRNRIAPSLSFDELEEAPSSNITPEENALKNELYETVNKCVDELDDKMRVVVLMYYNAEMSVEKIASSLNCPQGTVKSRLHKARAIIKNKLEVYGIDGF